MKITTYFLGGLLGMGFGLYAPTEGEINSAPSTPREQSAIGMFESPRHGCLEVDKEYLTSVARAMEKKMQEAAQKKASISHCTVN